MQSSESNLARLQELYPDISREIIEDVCANAGLQQAAAILAEMTAEVVPASADVGSTAGANSQPDAEAAAIGTVAARRQEFERRLSASAPAQPPAPAAQAPAQAVPPAGTFSSLESILEWSTAYYKPQPALPGDGSPLSEWPPASDLLGEAGSGRGADLALSARGDGLVLATFTPPQTTLATAGAAAGAAADATAAGARPTAGAHCLVVDVSYSMEQSATVTNDDGDKVDHGFTVLDIAKHAMCTYVASLDDDDWCCVACYANEARLVIGWTACTESGKAELQAAVRGLEEEGSTNLTAGLAVGMRVFEEELPPPVAANPSDYALLLAVATDGQPSSGTHPPGGPAGYPLFVKGQMGAIAAAHGQAAVPTLVAIGLGNDLDSRLLSSFSDTFLHIPDPGSVGSFMVNLLAATRATARLRTTAAEGAAAANHAVLRLSPASAVAAVPAYKSLIVGDEVHVPLGSLTFDQPRHVLILTPPSPLSSEDIPISPPPPLSAVVTLGEGSPVSAFASAAPAAEPAAEPAADGAFGAQLERTAAVCALQLQEARLSLVDELAAPRDEVARRLAREGGRFGDVTISLLWNDETDLDLHVTIPSGQVIMYSNKKSGVCELDVDMNAGTPRSKEPVENVYAGDVEKGIEAPRGSYKVQVHNFAYHSDEGLPEPRDIPFKVSVRMHGDVTEYSGVCTASKQMVDVVTFEYGGRLEGAAEQAEQLKAHTQRAAEEKARLAGVPRTLLEQTVALLGSGSPLEETLRSEALLAVVPDKFAAWGRHYLVTLPSMLRAERRSNFRDAALQAFGCDAAGEPGVFDSLASEAEQRFAELEPPRPSGLERLARVQAAAAAAGARAAAQPARTYTTMPEEFMRGGGCFAPDASLRVVEADGSERHLPIAEVAAGMRIRTGSGGVAAVRCVVVSPCEGAETVLTELPGGLRLTEWHPIQDARGAWRFPIVVGRRVAARVSQVYNLVLSREHVALVGGVGCATLGHGLRGPVIGHPFWGSSAVIEHLAGLDGWERGRVVLGEPLRSPA